MTESINRRNPARDVEKLAVAIVSSWLGAAGQVRDMSATHEPDFRIEYADGRLGIGEVGWHVDRELQAMWSNTFKRERHQVVALAPGSGVWSASLTRGAKINRLYAMLPQLISTLSQRGITSCTVYGAWPPGEPGDSLRALGIERLVQHESSMPEDVAYYFMPGSGGIVPSDPNAIVDWIDAVIADPGYQDLTSKLIAREAQERHAFIMAGSATPFGADERLRRLDEGVPGRRPAVPEGITHVWAVSQFLPPHGAAAVWSAAHGWATVPVPPVDALG